MILEEEIGKNAFYSFEDLEKIKKTRGRGCFFWFAFGLRVFTMVHSFQAKNSNLLGRVCQLYTA